MINVTASLIMLLHASTISENNEDILFGDFRVVTPVSAEYNFSYLGNTIYLNTYVSDSQLIYSGNHAGINFGGASPIEIEGGISWGVCGAALFANNGTSFTNDRQMSVWIYVSPQLQPDDRVFRASGCGDEAQVLSLNFRQGELGDVTWRPPLQ